MQTIRSILVAIALCGAALVAPGAGAAECVIAVFYNPSGPPASRLYSVVVTRDNPIPLRVADQIAVLQIRYENPLGNPVATTYSGHEEFGLGIVGPRGDGRTGLIIARYTISPTVGIRDTWYFVDGVGQVVEGNFDDRYPNGFEATVLDGLDATWLAVTDDLIINDARLIADAESCPA